MQKQTFLMGDILLCGFCATENPSDSTDIAPDEKGFWCDACDGFTYFGDINDGRKHRFTIILEDKHAAKLDIQKPDIKLAKQLSPLRYPGGKSKLIDYLYSHLTESKTQKLISPFTGGGSFELSMLEAGVVKELHLNDLDFGIYSLWWTILNYPYDLINRIEKTIPTHDDYFNSQSLIKSNFKEVNMIEAAWATLLVNRLAYSGIAKANPLGGKKGTQAKLLSRWNPNDLIKRVNLIHSMADRITITNSDALELIEEEYWGEDRTIFIDPPYVVKGKDLYNVYYTKQNHLGLSNLLDSLHYQMPGADLIVTYDYNKWLESIYVHPDLHVIGRRYSI